MAGLDPHQAGMPSAEIIFCQISPLHRITLDDETKTAANIPKEAKFFAWAYPIVPMPGLQLPADGSPERAFLDYGGYVYYSNNRDTLATNAVVPAPLGTLGLMFGRPQLLPGDIRDVLTRQGRFQEITLEPLAQKGAERFAWVRPGEFDGIAGPDGALCYEFRGLPPRYFPVVPKPVYTPEHLLEELEPSEAWVVVRDTTAPPYVEQLVLFDKRKSFAENVAATAAGMGVVVNNTEAAEVAFCRDSAPHFEMPYEEWQRSGDQGSVQDPWVAILRQAAGEGELELSLEG